MALIAATAAHPRRKDSARQGRIGRV